MLSGDLLVNVRELLTHLFITELFTWIREIANAFVEKNNRSYQQRGHYVFVDIFITWSTSASILIVLDFSNRVNKVQHKKQVYTELVHHVRHVFNFDAG